MISSIVKIPKGLLQDRVFSLLEIADVVGLDSALLNHDLRRQLLELISGAQLCTQAMKIDATSAQWFLNRNITVSALHVSNVSDKEADLSILKQLACSVDTVVSFSNGSNMDSDTLKEFMSSCRRTKALCLNKYSHGMYTTMDGSVLEGVAEFCGELQTIVLAGSTRVSAHNITALTSGCKRLVDLDFSSSMLSFGHFQAIAVNCPQLRRLEAHNTDFNDDSCKAIAQHCRDLRHLGVNWNDFLSDTGLAALVSSTELRTFYAKGNERISSQGIITLAQGCTKLEEIGIPECDEQIDLAVSALVQHCPALKVVHIDSPCFTDSSLLILRNCSFLHTLQLKFSNISMVATRLVLENCVHLQHFTISCKLLVDGAAGTDMLTDVATTRRPFHWLRVVRLSDCPLLTDAAFIPLASQCPNITELSSSLCTRLTDASIITVSSNCRMLLDADTSNMNISDAAVCSLVKNCPDLSRLNVGRCKLLTDDSASAIGKHGHNLRYLDVSSCSNLTDAGIVEILQNCCKLRTLRLSCCRNISSRVLEVAVLCGTRLRSINVTSCKVDADAASAFRSARPNCRLLW